MNKMSKERIIADGLSPIAPSQTRIHALGAIGLSKVDVATACGVKPRTINRWLKNPEKSMTSSSWDSLDTLRYVASILIEERGMEPLDAASWLTTVDQSEQRPIDIILEDSDTVIANAHGNS